MSPLQTLSSLVFTLVLGAPAVADAFHFSAPDAEPMRARVVHGVLLEEVDGNYRIRVEGGEITVPKALVKRIDKDGLTVADLEKREQGAREKLAAADLERRSTQRGIAAGRAAKRDARASEASLNRGAVAPDFRAAREAPSYVYDPVLDHLVLLDNLVEAEIRRGLVGVIQRVAQRELRETRRELRRALRRIR